MFTASLQVLVEHLDENLPLAVLLDQRILISKVTWISALKWNSACMLFQSIKFEKMDLSRRNGMMPT